MVEPKLFTINQINEDLYNPCETYTDRIFKRIDVNRINRINC